MLEWLSSYCKSLEDLGLKASRLINLYYNIVEPVLGYPRHRETIASLIGPSMCYNECLTLASLRSTIEDNIICIIGPSQQKIDLSDCNIIAAPEGGFPIVLSTGFKPLYITGDLDLELKSLHIMISTIDKLIVHLHGDNIERVSILKQLLSSKNSIVYTSQVETIGCTIPLGGFTDGDRAILIAMLMNAREVKVKGYDFTRPVYHHKGLTLDTSEKIIKLKLAESIIIESAKILGYKLIQDKALKLLRYKEFREL
ncbi:MAG: hypothetical protein QXE99_06105 [Acidilobaceae archaeon]